VQSARRAWVEAQPAMDVEKLVFVDETGASTNMTRNYGRAPKSRRCVGSAPLGWETTTLIAALRRHQLAASMVVDGPVDGELFLAWVERFRCPTLRRGDIVILENLSSHTVDGVQQAIALAGATVLYLPPYSPGLNPLEKFFSKLKSLLRKAAKRSTPDLWERIGQPLLTVSKSECANCRATSGPVGT